MSVTEPALSGLVPDRLKVRSARILLESLEVQVDIGFHEFEVGSPQRLLVTIAYISPPTTIAVKMIDIVRLPLRSLRCAYDAI